MSGPRSAVSQATRRYLTGEVVASAPTPPLPIAPGPLVDASGVPAHGTIITPTPDARIERVWLVNTGWSLASQPLPAGHRYSTRRHRFENFARADTSWIYLDAHGALNTIEGDQFSIAAVAAGQKPAAIISGPEPRVVPQLDAAAELGCTVTELADDDEDFDVPFLWASVAMDCEAITEREAADLIAYYDTALSKHLRREVAAAIRALIARPASDAVDLFTVGPEDAAAKAVTGWLLGYRPDTTVAFIEGWDGLPHGLDAQTAHVLGLDDINDEGQLMAMEVADGRLVLNDLR